MRPINQSHPQHYNEEQPILSRRTLGFWKTLHRGYNCTHMENGTNHHTCARVRVVSRLQPFPNPARMSLEGSTGSWVRLPPSSQFLLSGFHHLPSTTLLPGQRTNRSQSVTRLTTPICDMWFVWVVTRTHYPNARCLNAPWATSLEIPYSKWSTPRLSKISQIDHQVHISRLG
jgi:hypothetical protein